MAVVLTVGITSGVPSSGTGTVSTIDNMLSVAGTPSSNVLTVQNSSIGLLLASSSPGVVATGTVGVPSSMYLSVQGSTLGSPVTVYISSAITANLTPVSAGGYSVSSIVLSTTTNATLVSSAARQVYHIEGFNVSSLPAYVKFYNLSSVPTVGTTSVFQYFVLPNNTAGAGAIAEYVNGVPYSVGLSYTVTSSMSSSDATVIQSANAVSLSIFYK